MANEMVYKTWLLFPVVLMKTKKVENRDKKKVR